MKPPINLMRPADKPTREQPYIALTIAILASIAMVVHNYLG